MSVKAPVPVSAAAFSWSGLYVGGHAGYGWSNAGTTYTGAAGTALVAGGALPPGYDFGHDGFVGGGHIGFNWQVQSTVLGMEAEIGSFHIGRASASQNINTVVFAKPGGPGGYVGGNVWNSTANLNAADWIATLRGRVGVTMMDRWLVFGTGGFAWTDVASGGSLTRSFPANLVQASWVGSTSHNKTGYVVGGGVEYAMTGNWIVRAEGLYYDFSHTDDVLLAAAWAINDQYSIARTTHLSFGVVRAGLSYKF
jgi:outer membrane immunogenic protein